MKLQRPYAKRRKPGNGFNDIHIYGQVNTAAKGAVVR